MSRTEELIALAREGDEAASEALITENAGLIWAIARRYAGRGTELDDLYQIGCVGFLKAVEGFDLNFGTQFSTYAVPKISGEIRRFLRDDGAVKVSRGLKEQASAIKSARNHLTNALGREPSIQEISRQTGLTAEEIALAETATRCCVRPWKYRSLMTRASRSGILSIAWVRAIFSTIRSSDSVSVRMFSSVKPVSPDSFWMDSVAAVAVSARAISSAVKPV